MQLGPSPSIGKDEIWMLLSKHSDTRVEEEYISLQIREEISSTVPSKLPIELATDYTNSPHILVKFQPERPQAVVSVIIAKLGPRKETTFTLTAYSSCPVYFTDTSLTLPYTQSVSVSPEGPPWTAFKHADLPA